MSVLRKKPFIETLLGQLSADELKRLASVIDQEGTPEAMTLKLNSGNALPFSAPESVAGKIKLVGLNLGSEVCTGVLVYHSTSYCALIGTVIAEKTDMIPLYHIDVAKRIARPVVEKLTADELRRVLDDALESKGAGEGEVSIQVVDSLPSSGQEDTLYLTPNNASSAGGIVEIPVPTVGDRGKVLTVTNQGGTNWKKSVYQFSEEPTQEEIEEALNHDIIRTFDGWLFYKNIADEMSDCAYYVMTEADTGGLYDFMVMYIWYNEDDQEWVIDQSAVGPELSSIFAGTNVAHQLVRVSEYGTLETTPRGVEITNGDIFSDEDFTENLSDLVEGKLPLNTDTGFPITSSQYEIVYASFQRVARQGYVVHGNALLFLVSANRYSDDNTGEIEMALRFGCAESNTGEILMKNYVIQLRYDPEAEGSKWFCYSLFTEI